MHKDLDSVTGLAQGEQRQALRRLTITLARALEAGASPEDLAQLLERHGMPADSGAAFLAEIACWVEPQSRGRAELPAPADVVLICALGIGLASLGVLLAAGPAAWPHAVWDLLRILL